MKRPDSNAIRILLIDDHALFREGLLRLLEAEEDFTVVGCCSSLKEAMTILSRNPADVVLLDYYLENEKGVDFLTKAAECRFQGRTLILSAGVSNMEAKKLVELGAAGIFLKHDPPALLTKSIREVVEGRSWFSQKLLKELVQDKPARSNRLLSERERTVLHGVVEGQSNKEIGDKASLSESVVKAVLQQLFNKTGVRTRSQLVRVALEQYRGEF